MDKRKIGKTELAVSRLCLGTMTFGAQADESAAVAMVDCYLDRGGNFIDTANVYAAGRSEEILGRLLKGRREKVVLASKVGIKAGDGPDESGLSRAAICKGIEGSLRRLQTDYLDIYYLHVPDYATPLEESLEAVGQLVQKGMVRQLGVSNYAAWQVCRLLWLAEKHGLPRVEITQPMYNLLSRGIEQEFLPMCKEFAIGTAAYNPLAGGLLTGKHRPESAIPGTRFDKNQAYLDRYWHRANFDAVQELSAIADAAGRSLVSLSLNWMLHHTAVDCVILGASKLEQLQENLAAAEEGPLAQSLIDGCEAVWARLRGPSPRYNR
jgi:aryl-alcohol dehydrogenase-like predicted oxidoreductase